MVRISKQLERRNQSPRKPRSPGKKTGPRKDNLPKGYREHLNAVEGDQASRCYIGKVR